MSSKMQAIIVSALSIGILVAQPRTFPQPPAPKDVTITAIPGIIDAGATWKLVWQGDSNADGIVGYKNGLLFAQEQTNHVNMLDKNDKFSVFLSNGHGPGAVTIGPKGAIIVDERTCSDPGGHLGAKPQDCKEPTGVAALTPQRKVLADSFMGMPLGRVNDLIADKKGGVYFTTGTGSGVFYITPKGDMTGIGEKIRSNGINLSPDEKTLYVTNGPVIMAYDVQPDGSVKNQREWGKFEGGGNGDGMAIDATGRVFDTDTAHSTIQVFSPEGKYLGMIPTPRTAISVAFSGPGKKTLYAAMLGAQDANGQEIKTADGVRNTAMSVYKIQTLTKGFEGRAK
ncbi:MAG: SMP-30/gluconolactonase/LRE family protein [Bryobacteraceae bacterium]